jgi:hypothetical protein
MPITDETSNTAIFKRFYDVTNAGDAEIISQRRSTKSSTQTC